MSGNNGLHVCNVFWFLILLHRKYLLYILPILYHLQVQSSAFLFNGRKHNARDFTDNLVIKKSKLIVNTKWWINMYLVLIKINNLTCTYMKLKYVTTCQMFYVACIEWKKNGWANFVKQ